MTKIYRECSGYAGPDLRCFVVTNARFIFFLKLLALGYGSQALHFIIAIYVLFFTVYFIFYVPTYTENWVTTRLKNGSTS